MNKGAIFDVDGTLLDSMPIWEDASSRFLCGLGVQPEEGLGEIMFRMSLDEGASYLRSAYRLNLTDKEIKEGVLGVIRDFYFYQAQPKAGAREFLEQLRAREIPMYIATSSSREHVRTAFERLGMYEYFDGMITCEEAGAGKSEPGIYLQAARNMGLDPEDVFVFEDVIHAIRSANSAGFVSVGVYDKASAADNGAMRAESRIYLHSLENWDKFRTEAGL